jgi:hypothetical protein
MSSVEPAGVTIFQAEAPPRGSLVVRMLPSSSPATQKWALGQDSALMPALDARASASTTFHVEAAPVGSVETSTLPLTSPTTQRLALAHERASNSSPPCPIRALPTSTDFHLEGPPVGSVVVRTLSWAIATHNLTSGHDTAPKPDDAPGTATHLQADLPPVGSVDTNAWPPVSTAMHRRAEGHETERMPPVSAAKMAACQSGVLFAVTAVVAGAPAGGSAVVVAPAGGSAVAV